MKKQFNVIGLLISGLFISWIFAVELPPTGGEAASSQVQKSGSLNVRDFGAKGDGITDDSDAIQRALLQAAAPEFPGFLYWRWTAAPEVYFPEGTYLVSRTLLVPVCGASGGVSNHINLRGENATIKQIDPTQDILYFRMSHRNLIEGITFEGGRRQIKLWSRNMDEARVVIRDCTFRNSSGYAIDDQLRIDPEAEPRNWYHNILEPYVTKTNEAGLPILTAVDESQYPMCLFVSTGMRISNCSFERCMHVLSVWADWALMEHCSIETHPDMQGPAILSGAALMLEEVTGLAHVTPGKQQWWITVNPQKQPSGIVALDLQKVRLKTNSEKGLCVVRNEAKFTGGSHVYIIADNCEFQSAGSEENSVIYLVEAPNILSVRNSREISGRNVNLLGFNKRFDEDYFPATSPGIFSFVVDDNNQNLIAKLPEAMKKFADKPLPEEVAQRFEVKPPTITLPFMREGIDAQLNVMDFGAGAIGKTDDSEAFQKAFTAARKQAGLVEVIVPAGLYRMDQPIELPPRVVVRGVGNAALTVPAGREGPILVASGAEHLAVQNLHFFNCEQAIKITTDPRRKSNILIDYCRFHKNDFWAVNCLSGTGAIAEPNKTILRMSNCTFSFSKTALLHNALYALMDNPWISTDATAVDSGVIVNRGFFHLKALIGVARDTDQRWVDNYSQVFLDRCRFGGEHGGLPMVGNFAAKGQVLIQNSWLMIYTSFVGKPKRITIVDCEEIPDLIALRGNWGWLSPQMMVTVRQGAQGELDGRFFESGNTAPPSIKDERKQE